LLFFLFFLRAINSRFVVNPGSSAYGTLQPNLLRSRAAQG
jgi:hypothetical protein